MPRSLVERLAALEQSSRRPAEPELAARPHPGERPAAAAIRTDGTRPTGTMAAEAALRALGFSPKAGFWLRELRYDLLTQHGRLRFADADGCTATAVARWLGTAVSLDQLRWYDIEATGLGQGAGTVPFLHAVAQVEGDELVVRQYFLADYTGEAELLQGLIQAFPERTVVITFNGKSYDWPLLRSRLLLHRLSLPDPVHADLLHASRRLWRGHLARASLTGVEAAVLGIERNNDLPGHAAPARYFAYLAGAGVDALEPVFAHNAADVCSLVVLWAAVCRVLAGEETPQTAAGWVGLARWYERWETFDLAERCYAHASLCPDEQGRARWLYSLFLKRQQAWRDAVALWHELAQDLPQAVPPAVELAKWYEHHTTDLAAARHWAETALARARAQAHALPGRGADQQRVLSALHKRVERLERKLQARDGACPQPSDRAEAGGQEEPAG
ncbi:MAG: ribonuclease H-like domain-containing protein [Alicyclobacillus sp.]|nr:ribonuclease H-like domain-containing protein [Alicyclobacillus sp.]